MKLASGTFCDLSEFGRPDFSLSKSKKARGDSVHLAADAVVETSESEQIVVDEEPLETKTDFGSLKSRLSQTLQAIKNWKKTFPKALDTPQQVEPERYFSYST